MNPFDMLKNMNFDQMQSQLKAAQDNLTKVTASGSAGGNMVTVTLNGKFELVDIQLDPICVDNRDIPMLQDLIKAAHHAAMENVSEKIKSSLGPLMSAGL